MKAELSKDGSTIIVSIPMQMRKRGGRTLIVAPEGMTLAQPREESLVKLVVRAHHWLKLLKEKKFSSVRELAEHKGIDASYVAKILRLTLLAPDIVTLILDGRQPDCMTWKELRKSFPMLWSEQRKLWGIPEPV
ncbi:MAG: hypothetical protein HQM02_10150 [Magnetococcales bacterium]|nr:hypothetical protein [Magnetococcales bacterium]